MAVIVLKQWSAGEIAIFHIAEEVVVCAQSVPAIDITTAQQVVKGNNISSLKTANKWIFDLGKDGRSTSTACCGIWEESELIGWDK